MRARERGRDSGASAKVWDFGRGGGCGGGDLAEGFNLPSTSPFPLPEEKEGEGRRVRPRKKRECEIERLGYC